MTFPFFHSESSLFIFLPRYIRTTVLFSLLVSLVMGLLVSVLYFRLQPEVPLLYSLARPSEHLVAKEWLFLLPVLSIGVTVGHTIILSLSQHIATLLLKLFAWSTVAIQLLLLLALIRIVLIIT